MLPLTADQGSPNRLAQSMCENGAPELAAMTDVIHAVFRWVT